MSGDDAKSMEWDSDELNDDDDEEKDDKPKSRVVEVNGAHNVAKGKLTTGRETRKRNASKKHSESEDEKSDCAKKDLKGSPATQTRKTVDLTKVISCTACHNQINVNKSGSVHRHPVLKVLICKRCYEWYTSGPIRQGDDGIDEQCRWCGEGGKLVLCSQCNNTFCKDCIRTNLGRGSLSDICDDNDWLCFVCMPEPLFHLKNYCSDVIKAVKLQEENHSSAPSVSNSVLRNKDLKKKRASADDDIDEDSFADLVNDDNIETITSELLNSTEAFYKALASVQEDLKGRETSSRRAVVVNKALKNKLMQEYSTFRTALVRVVRPRNTKRLVATAPKSKRPILSETVNEEGNGDGQRVSSSEKSKSAAEKKSELKLNVSAVVNGFDVPETSEDEKRVEDMNGDLDADMDEEAEEKKVEKQTVLQKALSPVKIKLVPILDNGSETVAELSSPARTKSLEDIKSPVILKDMRIVLSRDIKEVDSWKRARPTKEDLEAQQALHRELLTDSDDEDDDDDVIEKKKENDEGDDDSSDDENEDEEDGKDSSSDDEYNPKRDARDMKKIAREERRKKSTQYRSLAAKKSLKKIQEKIAQKKKKRLEEEKRLKKNATEGKDDDDEDDDVKDKSKAEKKSGKNKKRSDSDDDDANDKLKSKKKSGKDKKKSDGDDDDDDDDMKDKSKAKKKSAKSRNNSKNEDDDNDKEGSKHDKKSDKVKKKKNSDDDEDADGTDNGEKKEKKSKKVAKTSDADDDEKDNGEDKLSDLDREIANMERIPVLKKKKTASKKKDDDKDDGLEEAENDDATNKKKKAKDEIFGKGKKSVGSSKDDGDLSSGEEGEDADDDEDEVDKSADNPTIFALGKTEGDSLELGDVDQALKDRQALLEDDDDEDEEEMDGDDSDDDAGKKKKLKAGKQGKKNKDEKEDEEVDKKVSKKGGKRLKLLNAKLSDSENDEEEKDTKKKSKGKKSKKAADKEDSDKDGDDDDSDVGKKKRKRKRKKSTSEEEDGDDKKDEDGEKKKSRRRRIKTGSDSDNEDGEKEEGDGGSSDDFQSPASKKRKKIRKILKDKKLSKETLDAAKEEELRRERICEQQKLFNQVVIEDASSPTKCPVTTKLVLEADPETKDPIIEVYKKVIRKLKPHQVDAVKFMWSCCYESLERMKTEPGSGCILAHCMGLGKTLSVIAFVHTVLTHQKLMKQKTVLVLGPLNTILNWETEFENWLDKCPSIDVYELSTVKDNYGRAELLQNWHRDGGVMIMGYEMFRNLSQASRVKNKRQKKIFTESLLDPGPDLIVCDEGHILKNDATGLSKACMQMRTKRRVVLTGTPLQNNLVEYHCMVNFVKPNLLGTRKEFLNRFVNPMTNGQCSDSTPRDVKIMKRRAHVLHETLAGCVQRKDYSSLTHFLPPKHEYVIWIRLSKVQITLYEKYLQRLSEGGDLTGGPVRGARIFSDYQNLMKIWTHPWVLRLAEIREETKKLNRRGSDTDESFLDDSENESILSKTPSQSDDEDDRIKANGKGSDDDVVPLDSDDEWKPKRLTRGAAKKRTENDNKPGTSKEKDGKGKKNADGKNSDGEEIVKGWKSRSRGNGALVEDDVELKAKEDGAPAAAVETEDPKAVSTEWWADYLKAEDQYKLEISGKLLILAEILRMAEAIGDKVLVFSQSLLSLSIIEDFLAHWDKELHDDPPKHTTGNRGWERGIDYLRMDGSTNAQQRKDAAILFNDPDNLTARLFLISTKAGSLGINLVASNRVIMFDASWNPSHDIQSIFRVYRFGQTKPVYVYRLLAQGTMEEKIYERQVTKLSLSQRVVDEHQIERHFTAADLREIYTFKPDRLDDPNRQEKPTPMLPKDRMLAELITTHKDWICNYIEHDSLLENKQDEELNEEERKAAWQEYEDEKKGIKPPNPAMLQYMAQMQNQQMMVAFAEQNQQLGQNLPIDAQRIARYLFDTTPGISQEDLTAKVADAMRYFAETERQRRQQREQIELQRLRRLQQETQRQEALMRMYQQQAAAFDGIGYGDHSGFDSRGTGFTASSMLSGLLHSAGSASYGLGGAAHRLGQIDPFVGALQRASGSSASLASLVSVASSKDSDTSRKGKRTNAANRGTIDLTTPEKNNKKKASEDDVDDNLGNDD